MNAHDDDKAIFKNKLILAIAILIAVFFVLSLVLLNSSTHDNLYFRRLHNQNTGEPLSVAVSLLFYILMGGLIGTLLYCPIFLFSLCLYYYLHRKDPRLLDRSHHPKYEDEIYFSGTFAAYASYIPVFIILILHIFNILTVNFFQ